MNAIDNPAIRLPHKIIELIEALGDSDTSLRVHGIVDADMRFREVRILIQELKVSVNRLFRDRDDADDYIKAIWRSNQLPSPMPPRLLNRMILRPKTVEEATGLRKGPALELAKQFYREGHTNLPPSLG